MEAVEQRDEEYHPLQQGERDRNLYFLKSDIALGLILCGFIVTK